jgi:hypothetical protein
MFLCAFCLGISKYNSNVQKWMQHHRQALPWDLVEPVIGQSQTWSYFYFLEGE